MNTDFSKLFEFLQTYYPVHHDLKEHLENQLQESKYPRNFKLLIPGQVPSAVWFIQKGSACAYTYNEKSGEKIIVWFWLEGDLMLAWGSFCRQLKSSIYIELLEDCTLQYLTFHSLKLTASLFPNFRQLEHTILEDMMIKFYSHYYYALHLSAHERYQKLLKENPKVFQIAPIKDIASFLGMFPDTLSRFRGRK